MRFSRILLLFLLAFGATAVHAQKKSTTRTFGKFKAPKLSTLLSTYKDSASVTPAEAENIIAMPLRIVDDKQVTYTLSSYQFLYRKSGVTEDEETGKVSPQTSILADRFKTSPLPENWVKKIREELKPGELLYFFDIIAKDAQGRVMYAPDVKITIQ